MSATVTIARRLRAGELAALLGAILVLVSLWLPSYAAPHRRLDAWDTFGGAAALLLVAVCAALAMVVSALAERSAAVPVASAIFCVALGPVGVIAAIVRVLERPDHATGLRAGSWLALAGTTAILAGAWEALRDERTSLYAPARPQPRPRP